MEAYRKWIDSLPLLIRIILALPVIDGIIYGIYRICKGTTNGLILGVVWVFIGAAIGWILDIVLLVMKGSVWEL